MASSKSESSTATNEVIPILRVKSAAASVKWYAQLGFKQEWEHRFQPDFPAFVEISNGSMLLFLSEHTGDASPDTLVFLRVADVDSFVADLPGAAEKIEDSEGIGMRDVEVEDPDGNRIRIGSRLVAREGKGYS